MELFTFPLCKVTIKMKLNNKGMEILISKLTAKHMWAIYLIGLEKEMPEQVPKADLVQIIAVLCTELGWNEADPI